VKAAARRGWAPGVARIARRTFSVLTELWPRSHLVGESFHSTTIPTAAFLI